MSKRYNLLEEDWIPIIRKNGDIAHIAPWQITEGENNDNPIVEIASPRPDFDGAFIQFLIGLIQTALPPSDEKKILTQEKEPISSKELKKSLEKYKDAFYLDGDGPRFMQEKGLAAEDKRADISQIFIEYPGEITKEKNIDHFIHRGRVRVLCPSCAAAALFCLQINGPAGGSGHRTSLRGGGPLTTIIKGPTVWKTVCRNLLTEGELNRNGGDPEKRELKYIFPWLMDPAITSENNETIVPDDMNPFHVFWSMSRRIYLVFEEEEEQCSFCKGVSNMICRKYIRRTKGIHYNKGAWKHPLTPYRKDDENALISLKPRPGGFSYRYWIGWIQKDNKTSPAEIVDNFIRYRYREKEFPRIKGFGYNMSDMKAQCWYEGEMPLIWIEEKYSAKYQNITTQFIKTAQNIVGQLDSAIKKVATGKIRYNKKRSEDEWIYGKGFDASSIREESNNGFWKETEPFFYESLLEIRKGLVNDVDKEEIDRIKLSWVKKIHDKAIQIFDIYSSDGNYDAIDPYKIVRARRELISFTSPSSKKIMNVLGIVTNKEV